MAASPLRNEHGKTLAELLCALVMSGFSMGAMYNMMLVQNKVLSGQDYEVGIEQLARTTMDRVSRDLQMAGYRPVQGVSFDGVTYDPAQLRILADLNGNGTTTEVNEEIIYSHDAATFQLSRSTGGVRTVVHGVQGFTFSYLNADGNPATKSADIRQVLVTLTARAPLRDPNYPANGGFRTFTLQSRLAPRNLGVAL
jgi:hypothetical protein